MTALVLPGFQIHSVPARADCWELEKCKWQEPVLLSRVFLAKPDFAAVCLLAITGYGQEADRRQSREAGFEQPLVKPIKYSQLLAAWAAREGH